MDKVDSEYLNDGLDVMHELARRNALPDESRVVYEELKRRGAFGGAKPQEAPKTEAQPAPKMSQLEATARAIGQGLSFDWGDEIYGYGSNLPKLATEGVDAYKAAAAKDTAAVRENNRQAAKEYPKTFLAGEIGGGLATILPAMLLPGGQPAAAARAATLASKIKQGAAAGAGYGAVVGAGNAESAPDAASGEAIIDTGMGALKGGAAGGLFGAALPPVLQAGGAAVRAVTNPIQAYRDPTGFAARKTGEALYRDGGGQNSAGVAQMLQKGDEIAQTVPGTVLADVGGDATKKLMRSAINTPNQETTAFQKMLDTRAKGQAQVIEDKIITPHFGDPKAYTQNLDDILAKRNAEATPAFEKAWAGDFQPSNELVDLLQSRPLLRPDGPIIKQVQANVNNARGEGFRPTDLEVAHLVKLELDNMIKWAENPISRLNNSGAANVSDKALRQLRDEYVKALKGSQGQGVKDYTAALAKYGEESNVARAMELGRKVGRGETPDNIRKTFADMTPFEKDAYRQGVGYSMAEKNRTGHYHADRVRRDWDTPATDARLNELFPLPKPGTATPPPGTPDPLANIERVKEALNAQRATRNAAQGNSTTAAQLKAMEDSGQEAQRVIKTLDLAKDAIRGNWSAVLAKLESGAARLGGMTPNVAAEVLRLLGQKGPAFPGMMQTNVSPAVMQALTDRAKADARMRRIGDQTVRGLFAGSYGPQERQR